MCPSQAVNLFSLQPVYHTKSAAVCQAKRLTDPSFFYLHFDDNMLKLRNKIKCSRALRRRCIAKEDAYETSDRLCAGAVSDGLSVFRSRSRRFARWNCKMDDAAGYERRSDRNDPCGGNGGRAEEPLAAERAYIRTQPHRPSDGDLWLDALRQKHHEQDRSLSGR